MLGLVGRADVLEHDVRAPVTSPTLGTALSALAVAGSAIIAPTSPASAANVARGARLCGIIRLLAIAALVAGTGLAYLPYWQEDACIGGSEGP